jgi:hypothetical protein
MTSIPLYRVLVGWVALGAVRVLLGDSTSFAAYVFFGLFWVVSIVLLFAALWQLKVSRETELTVEAICICIGLGALFLQGLLGHHSAAPVAAIVFFVSAIILLILYGRRAIPEARMREPAPLCPSCLHGSSWEGVVRECFRGGQRPSRRMDGPRCLLDTAGGGHLDRRGPVETSCQEMA